MIILSGSWIYAQKSELKQVEQSKELYFTNTRQKSLELPFKLVNNLIVIPIQINGSDTLRFILDTGLNTSIICELSTGKTLNLNYAREIQLQGLGVGEPLSAIHTFGNDINISGIYGINQDYFVLMENIFHLSNKLGTPIHGILSFSVFNAFIVEINYTKEKIVFYDPAFYQYKKNSRNYITLPMVIHETKPYIYMKIQLADGRIIPIKVLLDTGASNSLWVDQGSLPDFSVPGHARQTYLGSGLSGDVYGHVLRFDKVYIDHYELSDVIVSLPDSSSIENAIGLDQRNGSIGAEILRRFNVIIDYPNELITFVKNSDFLDPFSYNMTGIELSAPYPGINYYTISQIRKGSPAEKAGLLINDEIISINSTKVTELTMNDLYKKFQLKNGKKIKMLVNRNGERKRIEFKLEKFI
ncbi:MAG: PDZ domain-containing protein [Bacteroidales bacterium]|nr:PDZ domain-containing protein [Bacteroidales bacterium]